MLSICHKITNLDNICNRFTIQKYRFLMITEILCLIDIIFSHPIIEPAPNY